MRRFLGRNELRFLDIEFAHAGPQGAAVKVEDFRSTVFATYFPFGLLKHLQNVVPLDRS